MVQILLVWFIKMGSPNENRMKERLESEVAYEILSYLVNHPHAEGPIEAITEWWLLEQRIEVGIKEMSHAIDELVGNGYVLERKSQDRHVFYRINSEKNEEIRQLLKSKGVYDR